MSTSSVSWRQRLSVWGGRVLAVILGILSAWLLLEIALRLVAEQLPMNVQAPLRQVYSAPWSQEYILEAPLLRSDNYFGYVNTPNLVNRRTVANSGVTFHATTLNWLDPNSHVGFRVDTPDWQPRWPVDVVTLGDSFTFCYTEYEDCWSTQLADTSGLSVVNLGLIATGSTSHLRVLKTFGLSYKPRMVIWQWYGNDYYDDYWLDVISGAITTEVLVTPEISCEPTDPIQNWLRHHSAVYAIGGMFFCASPLGLESVDPYQTPLADGTLHFGQKAIRDQMDMSNFRNKYGLDLTREALLAARDLLAETNTSLVIVLMPTKEETYRPLTEPVLGADRLAALAQGREVMLAFCKSEGLHCLDLLPALQARAADQVFVYWPTDLHLNAEGNHVIAQAIYEYLQAQKLAP